MLASCGKIGGWEILLLIAVVLVLWGAWKLPNMARGLGEGMSEFKRALQEMLDEIAGTEKRRRPDDRNNPNEPMNSYRSWIILWVAQGFGVGRIPIAPGTFGSMVGVAWCALLVWTGSLGLFLAAAIEGIALSVWFCDDAEKILKKKDPSSVVLDEIIAIPFCFIPWVVSEWKHRGHVMPPVETFFSGHAWWYVAGLFLLFRIFDIWKPWPIYRLQDLPGGWGVTADDVLAAIYVAILSIIPLGWY